MKKYKFRLWDNEHKKFLEDDLYTEYFINTFGTVNKVTEYDFGGYSTEISVSLLDNIEISQYTNLKDSYGNEIYEKDIVWNEWDEVYQVVLFEDGEYKLVDDMYKQSLYENLDYIYIRGNVYENFELIKEWYSEAE